MIRLTYIELLDLAQSPVPQSSMELRHNDLALGHVCGGAVECSDWHPAKEAYFWLGLSAFRRARSVCSVPA